MSGSYTSVSARCASRVPRSLFCTVAFTLCSRVSGAVNLGLPLPSIMANVTRGRLEMHDSELFIDALATPPFRSKVTLAVISGLGLGACGIDRCYMAYGWKASAKESL